MRFSAHEIERGDYVRDRADGKLHRVSVISQDTIYFEDGGCCGEQDVTEVLLESEAYDEAHR